MVKYLITPTLLNSFEYYMRDEFSTPIESRINFLRTLSKEKFAPTEAMQKGIDFESAVCRVAEHLAKWKCEPDTVPALPFASYQIVKGLAEVVKYGIWQTTVKKNLQVGGQEFLLYGKTDVIKNDTIFDIKYTSNYELGKFTNSAQHLIYLYCAELPKFAYLISDGKDWWKEDYFLNEETEEKIKSKISDLMDYLKGDQEAQNIFNEKWQSYN